MWKPLPPNDSSKASLSPPVGGRHRSFRRDWQTNKCSNNVLNIITNGYVLPFISKPNLARVPLIQSGYKALQALTTCIQPVSSVKERYRKGEKCKISRVLQSPVSCTQTSPKVEASNRPKQAQDFSTCRKVQNGNSRVHQNLSDSRGMGIVDRPIRGLPSHPHPPKLKEIPKVLPQVAGVPAHLSSIWPGHSPSGLYNDCKGSEANGPHEGTQTSPIPGRLTDQVPVSGSEYLELVSPSEHSGSDLTQSLMWIINQQKSELKPTQVFSSVGYEYHLDSALVKLTREMAHTQDLILRLKSKYVLTARCLMSLIGLLASMKKMVPERCLHMRSFQFHLKEHWRYPQSLDSLLPWTETISGHLEWWQNPTNKMKGATCVGCNGQHNSSGLHKQTRRNSLLYALLWKIMTWCHHYQITLKARHIPGCLNVMVDLLSKCSQQNGHCIHRCSYRSVKSGSPLM